jgi:hypothetical protein
VEGGGFFNPGKEHGEPLMARYAMLFPILIFLVTLLGPQIALSQKSDPTIVDFKIQALYRAARLTWKASDGLKDQMSLQILRAETFEEGPYQELDAINLVPGKNDYEYVDKSMGTESKYYYKLAIKETGEFFGPIPTRPYFSPPATQWHPSEQEGPLLALREARR